MKAVLNVETYLHCSQDSRDTQHGLWPGGKPARAVWAADGGQRLTARLLRPDWNYAAIFQRLHMGSRSITPLLRNPTDVRHCSQHAGANVDFGDEGAVDWAFLGNLKQLRALLLG